MSQRNFAGIWRNEALTSSAELTLVLRNLDEQILGLAAIGLCLASRSAEAKNSRLSLERLAQPDAVVAQPASPSDQAVACPR